MENLVRGAAFNHGHRQYRFLRDIWHRPTWFGLRFKSTSQTQAKVAEGQHSVLLYLVSLLPCQRVLMPWTADILAKLAAASEWSYHPGELTATEPAAFAALALLAHEQRAKAQRPLQWLSDHQNADGSLGISAEQDAPGWPTSLAILAWSHADSLGETKFHRPQINRAVEWLLGASGNPLKQGPDLGHDTTLVGWPWVLGTHSWLEPSAFAVSALKAAGHAEHPRTREAVRLVIDRLLPNGGANYGNISVLGQTLRPLVQISGMALAAIADEADRTGKIKRTVEYLRAELTDQTTAASLAFALIGLGAYGATPESADAWLSAAASRTFKRDASSYKLALLALAAKAREKSLLGNFAVAV